uniref:NB-ARC domain-containing protein n=1 Tax=Plectus sambesii TaxID=2011161 RepID=A0A914VCF7_9BILA
DVETALHFVRQAILDSYPNLLIVLDDVWSADIVGAFDELQCRILATTRNKSLFNVAICEKEFVAMNPVGFTKTEALNVLAQYAGCKPSELPNEASAIFQLCEGHPLVINLIGSLIREHEERWQRYYEELKAQHLDDIEHKTPYRYSTFYKAAKISCDDLTPQQLKNFCAFAIFPVNVLVPDAVSL